MTTDIPWPKKGDNPFSDKNAYLRSPTWCSLNWLSNLNIDDSFYANAFKKAADKIISEMEKGEDPEHPDPMFIPIAYLYRHCLELKMKNVIRKGLELRLISLSKEETADLFKTHRLHKIWNVFRKIVTAHWTDAEPEPLNATERIILAFHEVDQSGQNLRYTEDTKGDKTSDSLPPSVELLNLRQIFEGAYNLLDGCEMEFDYCLDSRNEMLSEYRNYQDC